MLKLLMLKSIGWDDSTKVGDVHINLIYLTKFVAYKFIWNDFKETNSGSLNPINSGVK
jgi:hypothetical protein